MKKTDQHIIWLLFISIVYFRHPPFGTKIYGNIYAAKYNEIY